jgi:hypothetical protein
VGVEAVIAVNNVRRCWQQQKPARHAAVFTFSGTGARDKTIDPHADTGRGLVYGEPSNDGVPVRVRCQGRTETDGRRQCQKQQRPEGDQLIASVSDDDDPHARMANVWDTTRPGGHKKDAGEASSRQ